MNHKQGLVPTPGRCGDSTHRVRESPNCDFLTEPFPSAAAAAAAAAPLPRPRDDARMVAKVA